ncbi:MAG: dTMP kinase [Candidatus Omnitrophica bacterium]|nr:dTMP kinase [Candidatus Omnitrophota bacterium]
MEKKTLKKATFITVEGLEGSGKSSVVNFLANFLKEKKFTVKVFRDPGSTDIGEKIRALLLDKKNKKMSKYTELLLYLAARAQLIEEKLKGAFKNYDFVICDRFFDSTIVYQGYALGLGKLAKKAVEMFLQGIRPDLTIVLITDPQAGLKRIRKKDRIESRPLSFHDRLKNGYLKLAEKEPARIKVIDANTNLDAIFDCVKKILCKKFI